MKAFQDLYVLCFTRPRYQVSVYRTTGPLVYRKFIASASNSDSESNELKCLIVGCFTSCGFCSAARMMFNIRLDIYVTVERQCPNRDLGLANITSVFFVYFEYFGSYVLKSRIF